jgi:Protein of unknown function (DUF4058)
MPSPFPGMDPYVEAFGNWEDFHDSFLTYLRDVLRGSLPTPYSVFMQERVTSISLPDRERTHSVPDIGLTAPDAYRPPGGIATLAITGCEPVVIEHDLDESATETYIEITRRSDRKLITVIEFLSPSNKESPGAPVYLAKRAALLHQYVHLVEIDLLLRGTRLPMRRQLPAGEYYTYVSRAENRPKCDVYAWGVRSPLPVIPVPLMAPDADYQLDLGALFRQAYETGHIARELSYAGDPPAFLRPADREWARSLVRPAPANPAPQ